MKPVLIYRKLPSNNLQDLNVERYMKDDNVPLFAGYNISLKHEVSIIFFQFFKTGGLKPYWDAYNDSKSLSKQLLQI